MEKLKMKTLDAAEGNVAKIAALFPQCVTERIGKSGTAELAIDFDKLRDELSKDLLDGAEERYQFTWPDKRAASRLANAETDKTLRPDLKASEDFWNTKNLYIEGDNLDVLKVLREDYLGAIKMIYIDPPYNTGNDFVYNDDFAQSREDFEATSGAFDEDGNQLIDPMQRNSESNGRFHTDWLNMIYPRLKVARDLLSDDGVIYISMDDSEVENLHKICDEIFGRDAFIAQFIWKSRQNKDNRNTTGVSIDHEYILCYSKSIGKRSLKGSERKTDQYTNPDNDPRGPWASGNMAGILSADLRPNCHYDLINPKTGINYGRPKMGWRYDKNTMNRLIEEDRILWPSDPSGRPRKKTFLSEITEVLPGFSSIVGDGIYTRQATLEVETVLDARIFDYPKPIELIKEFVNQSSFSDSIILDFFSGSATTAHAVMKLNAEDGGKRKFIMVQLPEITDEKSEARKAGYETICQIGEERIRRAGKKVKEEAGLNGQDLDTGFRVLKLDSSNMEDVFYTPEDFDAQNIFTTVDNVKSDRTPLDLLFQVLPELNIELSAKIEEKEVNGKKVFFVDGDYLIATFDTEVNESTVTEIAKMKPQYFVMRDASAANDNVLDNFEQIFRHYSPDTIRKIL